MMNAKIGFYPSFSNCSTKSYLNRIADIRVHIVELLLLAGNITYFKI